MKRSCLGFVALAALLSACRGQPSEKSPLHLVPDLDWQDKYRPEQASAFFEDGRTMRPLVPGTVAQGHLNEDDRYHRGKHGGQYVAVAPIDVDAKVLARGQERYGIYCTPCHDQAGHGQGMAVKRGFPIPLDLSSERARTLPDGELFEVISDGVRNMPSYRNQIPVEDRWAIVSWVRVLQRSQHATIEDVPAEFRDRIEPEGATP